MENSLCSECTNQVLKDFYKTEFDETDFEFHQCTRSFRASGFGSPQYVNAISLGMSKEIFVHLKFLRIQISICIIR